MRRLLLFISSIALISLSIPLTRVRIDEINEVECAEEDRIREGKYILTHFSAWVDVTSENGKKESLIESTRKTGLMADFLFAKRNVYACWFDSLKDKCKGTKAVLVCPPEWAFNDGVTVKFEVEVVKVSEKPLAEDMFVKLDTNDNGVIERLEFSDYFEKRSADDVPWGLFAREDLNEDDELTWVEFKGPKGTQPPVSVRFFFLLFSSSNITCYI